MVIGGGGGHSLEIMALIQESEYNLPLAVYDENPEVLKRITQIPTLSSLNELSLRFQSNADFCFGIGNPNIREKFDHILSQLGGILNPIISSTSVIQSESGFADVMSFGFVGPKVSLGRGVLVNTRAHIHHECEVGDYSEIGPGAMLLGNVKIGKKCRIGAGAIILPGIVLGDEVIVGAGAVVTKNIPNNEVVAGVPAKSIKK